MLGGALVLAAGITPAISAGDPVVASVRHAVVLGVAAGWTWWLAGDGGRPLLRDRWLVTALAMCALAVLVSALMSPVRADALLWSFGEGTSAAYWLASLAILAGAATVPLGGSVRSALAIVTVLVLAFGIIGVAQRFTGVSATDLIVGGSNRLGPLCAMTAAVSLGLASTARERALRLGWFIGAATLGVCAVLSGAASATVATVLGLGAALLWHPGLLGLPVHAHRGVRMATAIVLAAIAITVVTAATTEVLPRSVDDLVDREVQSESGAVRLQLWDMAGRMAVARPLSGWGPDGFEYGGQRFVTQEMMSLIYDEEGVAHDPRTVLPQDPHSFVMTVAAELGLPGVAAFVMLVIVWIRRAWRTWDAESPPGLRDALVVAAVAMASASFFVPADPVGGVTGVLVAGLAISRADHTTPGSRTPLQTAVASIVTMIAITLAALVFAGAATVESAFRDATDARILSDDLALAVRLQPGSSMRIYQHLWADANRVGVDLTVADFASRYQAAPPSVGSFAPYATRLVSIVVYRDRSEPTLAWGMQEADRIVALAPAYPESHILKATIAARQGRVGEARRVLSEVEWASASAAYQTCVAEIAALEEGQR